MRFVWGVIKRWCAVAITGSMMVSCSASWHLKRAIAKDPTINAQTIVHVDTTVVTNEIRVVDTLVVRDTITRHINRDGAVVKIKRITTRSVWMSYVHRIRSGSPRKFLWTVLYIKNNRSNVPCWISWA